MSKVKLKISSRLLKKKARKNGFGQKKHCRFCGNKEQINQIDYKNINFLKGFLTERGKILPSRISGNCSLHQRELTNMIKRSRIVALLPYTSYSY